MIEKDNPSTGDPMGTKEVIIWEPTTRMGFYQNMYFDWDYSSAEGRLLNLFAYR